MEEFNLENGKIIRGDCKNALQTLENRNDIVLGFTSPPYFNAINYEGHIEKLKGEKDRWERKDVSYEKYKNFLIERFKALFDVIKPGGYNIVNIAPVHWKGRRIPLPFHFVTWMTEIGWKFKEDIIWEKPVARDRRSGVLLQHPYPGSYFTLSILALIFFNFLGPP